MRAWIAASVALLTVLLAASPSHASEHWLVAQSFGKQMQGGELVPMWGFAPATDGFASVGAPSVPGPRIVIPPGDATLTIHLRNDLAVPISLIVPGLPAGGAPVTAVDPQGRTRVVSFAPTTAPGAVGTYTFTGVRPGTLLYHSGTNPSVQVPMGLYGAVSNDAAAGQAYPGVAYDNEALLLFSEVDPALNRAVAEGIYGTAAYPSSIRYRPVYFLINGESHPVAQPTLAHPVVAGERLLLRMINAGLESHVPTLGLHMELLGSYARPVVAPVSELAPLLAAGMSLDALVEPSGVGTYAIYDRRLFLTGASQSFGGMSTWLQVGAASGALAAADDVYAVSEDTTLDAAAPGVLGNDSGTSLGAELVSPPAQGTFSLAPDGSFSYAPTADFSGDVWFTYRAVSGTVKSNVASVRIAVAPVADAPRAQADTATVVSGGSVLVPVLSNDVDPDGDMLTITNLGTAAHGTVAVTADGRVEYRSTAGYSGSDAFTYEATDGTLTSGPVSVTVTVTPRVNQPPVAVDDFASTPKNTAVLVNVVANDRDPDGTIDASTVRIEAQPSRGGTVVVHANGTVTFTPKRNFRGTDVFTYSVRDGEGARSNTAKVSINVK